jgi:hypothetical protein
MTPTPPHDSSLYGGPSDIATREAKQHVWGVQLALNSARMALRAWHWDASLGTLWRSWHSARDDEGGATPPDCLR